MAYDLINFCEFSEDNQEKQDEIYSHMIAMEIYLKSLPLIKIKVCDDKFDFNTQDIVNGLNLGVSVVRVVRSFG